MENWKIKKNCFIFQFSIFSLLLYPYQSNFQFSIFHFQLPIMITFVCCLIALIVGYFVYGKFIERIFGIDAKRQTPAYTHQDAWIIFRCQLGKSLWSSFWTSPDWDRSSAPLWERSSEPLLSCGSCWEVSLPVQYTITCPGCCPCVITGRACLRLSAVTWAWTSSSSCVVLR